jgi:hypothetical protein
MQTHDENIQEIQAENIEVNELFAEELPDQNDLATPAATWGSVGCFGSLGTVSGTVGTGSTVSSGSSFG